MRILPSIAQISFGAATLLAMSASAQTPQAQPRERPAMLPCPWPVTAADTAVADPKAPPPPTGVVDPPRARITDCAPPGWKPPEKLREFTPPPLPADRPKGIAEEYLTY